MAHIQIKNYSKKIFLQYFKIFVYRNELFKLCSKSKFLFL